MKITYLGTAAAEGWPALFCRCPACKRAQELAGKNIRTRSQALIDGKLLIDFPPDTYLHFLRGDLPLPEIRHLLITHSHTDHFCPSEFEYHNTGYAPGLTQPLTVYGSETVYERFIHEYPLAHDAQAEKTGVCFTRVEPFVPFEAEGYRITAVLARHDPNERCYNYLIEGADARLLYAHDTGLYGSETLSFLSGKTCSLVSLDCTSGAGRDGNYHMGIEDNLEFISRLKEVGACDDHTVFVANHFSHNMGLLYEEIQALLEPHHIIASYDGLCVQV